MSVSRRGFLRGTGSSVFRCVHCRARHGGIPPRLQDRSGRARWCRRVSPRSASHSNENPLGTRSRRARCDPWEVSGGEPLSLQQHAERIGADRRDRGQVQGQTRQHRPWRRIAGDAEERRARVHVADPRARHRRRRPSRIVRALPRSSGIRLPRSKWTRRSGWTSRR